ncbi:hypothetical protein G7Y79_00011g031030 [Physcia stellaris]|nr:hypothetical protein G7Y79_00011g031030 [Physcia stellaris]
MSPPSDDADFAQAFQELAKGERTAAAMETQLTALERKIDDLLASVDNGSSEKHAAANDPEQSKEKGAQS